MAAVYRWDNNNWQWWYCLASLPWLWCTLHHSCFCCFHEHSGCYHSTFLLSLSLWKAWYPLIWNGFPFCRYVSWIQQILMLFLCRCCSSSVFLRETPSAFQCMMVILGLSLVVHWAVALLPLQMSPHSRIKKSIHETLSVNT